jgi:superfamily II DNA or RNA helicase
MSSRTWLCTRGYAVEKEGRDQAGLDKIRKKLTVKPKTSMDTQDIQPYPIYREDDTWLYVPKHFGLQTFGAPLKDSIPDGEPAPRLVFSGAPRKEQLEPIEKFVAAQNGLLILPCGFGKTVCALYIATQFKKKTLIICHKGFLMDQWRERIAQYIPSAKVGTIKQSTVDIEDRDIVIASLQSLAMREYDRSIFKRFGFVCIDEVHHTSAEVFSRALQKVVCKRILGLSATPDRKDGLRKVFEWFIGAPVYEVRKRSDTELLVRMEQFYDPHPDFGRELHLWNGKLNVAKMINAVCSFEPRNVLIIDTLAEILAAEPTRKVLILSERRGHLETLRTMIKARNLGTTGYYVGGMTPEQLKRSESKDIILATYHIAAEGFDVPALNTLILASPVSSIEQPVGRIQRQKPADRTNVPLVVDIWDTFSIFRMQGFRRIKFYKNAGYTFTNVDSAEEDDQVDDDEPKPKKYTFVRDDDDNE